MIVKNEEASIERALRSVIGTVDEMIVVDTGSSDRTVELAKKMGAKVLFYEWGNDFSAVRNFALDQASSNWTLQLDADEELHSEDKGALRALANTTASSASAIKAYRLKVVDANSLLEGFTLVRFFINDRSIRYTKKIHEYPEFIDGNSSLASATETTDIRIIHHGYDPQKISEGNKQLRNYQILQRCLEEEPDSLHYLYHMGQELLSSGKLIEALEYLLKAYRHKDARSMPIIFRAVPLTLIHVGRPDDALEILKEIKSHYSDWREVNFLSAVAHLMNFELVEAETEFKKILDHAGMMETRLAEPDKKHLRSSEMLTTAGSDIALPNFFLYILSKMRGDRDLAKQYFEAAIPLLKCDLGMIYFIFASMIPVFNENIVKDEIELIIDYSPPEIAAKLKSLLN